MPGGRNKYTGPVNYSAEEVGGILNGSFYTTQGALPPAGSSSSSPNSGLLQTEYSTATSQSQKSPKNQFLQNPFTSFLPQQSAPVQVEQQRVQKRRRSLASDQQGVPFAKMMASLHRSPHPNPSPSNSAPSNPSESSPEISSQVQSIAEKVIDRLSDAEEKNILDIESIWPSFKRKESLSKEELFEAFPKIAEEVSIFILYLASKPLNR